MVHVQQLAAIWTTIVCFGRCQNGHYYASSPYPKAPLASLNLNLGTVRVHVNIESDGQGIPTAKQLENLRVSLHIPQNVQHQLQLITKDLLLAFGLYEPFRKQTKAIVLNNPVYYGAKSGMVNYTKNLYGKLNVTDDTETKSFKWEGIDGNQAGSESGDDELQQDWGKIVDESSLAAKTSSKAINHGLI